MRLRKYAALLLCAVMLCGGGNALAESSGTKRMPGPTVAPDAVQACAAVAADDIIDAAKLYLGYPYAERMSGPDRFDCSGFACYIFGLFDIQLKNSALEQSADSRCEWIGDIGDLQKGDLVFFDTIADADLFDHVGIYIGDDQLIHASFSRRQIVISAIDAQSNNYFYARFSGARRVLGYVTPGVTPAPACVQATEQPIAG